MLGLGVQDWWQNAEAAAANHSVGAWLFLRALGVTYAFAFLSLAAQIKALAGREGILPAREFLQQVREKYGRRSFLEVPTLCWLNCSDAFLKCLCWGGAALGLAVAAGLAQLPALILAWIFYVSLFSVARLFLGYQWDCLLLEAGFIAIFLAPWQLVPGGPNGIPPWPILVVLYWLLFRLMFLSGLVKLRSGDWTWKRLTALTYHYQTQPLPTRPAWFAHQFPENVHKFSAVVMFAIELGAPFLIFAPPPFRHVAAFLIITLMLLIMLTGNYAFFNLLTIALCLPLFDNGFYASVFGQALPEVTVATGWPLPVSIGVAALLVTFSVIRLLRLFRAEPRIVRALSSFLDTYPIVNHYGLFSVMTASRLEIVVEGSGDGETWLPYEFKFKPSDQKRAPPWVAPHQPRLDWQMWFAALSDYRLNGWFIGFLIRLLQGSAPVLALLKNSPFPNAPPLYARAIVYEYRFTTHFERGATGAWWTREKRWLYCPVYSLRGPEHQLTSFDDA
jgi:lipase maturation factor 1